MGDPQVEALQEAIRRASTVRAPLCIAGGRTKDFCGEKPAGDVLDVRAVTGIVDYQPTELVITARAGTPLADIEAAMRDAGQMLAFEPPRFAPGGTLGGAIAAGLSGPRRPYSGAARDFVLGVGVIDGIGRALGFGGRVMKNVAGFDVSRLMVGAMGTLGVLTSVSLKCLPLPREEATRVFETSADEAIRKANEWGGEPLPLSATCFHQGRFFVRLSGAPPAVASAIAKLGGEALADAAAFWDSVRDHRHVFFTKAVSSRAALWRLSVGSTAPHTDLGGEQLIEWGGALRWLAAGPRTEAVKVRAWAASQGGHATLFRAPDRNVEALHPLTGAQAGLHRRLKATFDPHGVLNPGRLVRAY